LINEEINPTKIEYAITKKVYNESYFKKDGFLKHFNRQRLIEKGDKYIVKGAANITIKSKKESFSKKLYLLMNGASSSTTGQLLGLIKSFTNAKFLGEESGGNPVSIVANDMLTLVLPNSKIEVRIPMIYSKVNTNFENQGRGIIPDKKISQNINEWISDKDVILEKTLNWIYNEKDGAQ